MGSYSAASLCAEYEASIFDAQRISEASRWRTIPMPVTAREQPGRQPTVSEALHAVGNSAGPYNWVLLDSMGLELHNAGCGGLEEMRQWLGEDKVLFGALRL